MMAGGYAPNDPEDAANNTASDPPSDTPMNGGPFDPGGVHYRPGIIHPLVEIKHPTVSAADLAICCR
jgi:hypothetical protein